MTTLECAWHHTTVTILGAKVIGMRGFDFDKKVDKEAIYASGNEPVDIQTGNKTYTGTITVLKYELDKLNDAALAAGFEDITEVPHEAITITCTFQKRLLDPKRVIVAAGVAFNDLKAAMTQAAKFTEVQLPFVSMKITLK